MHTVLVHAVERTRDLGLSRPLLFPLFEERELFEIKIQSYSKTHIEEAFLDLKKLLDYEIGNNPWQLIFLLSLYEEKMNPYASCVSARMKLLQEFFLKKDHISKDKKPINVFLIFLDNINHSVEYINEDHKDYNLSYGVDQFGFLSKSGPASNGRPSRENEKFQLIKEEKFIKCNAKWRSEILPLFASSAGGKKPAINVPLSQQDASFRSKIEQQVSKVLDVFKQEFYAPIEGLLNEKSNILEIDHSGTTLIDKNLLKSIEQHFKEKLNFTVENLENYRNFNVIDILRNTLQSYIGLTSIPNQDRFKMLRIPFLGESSDQEHNLLKINILLYLLSHRSRRFCEEFKVNKSYLVKLEVDENQLFQVLSKYYNLLNLQLGDLEKERNRRVEYKLELKDEKSIHALKYDSSPGLQGIINQDVYDKLLAHDLEDIEDFDQMRQKWFGEVYQAFENANAKTNSELGIQLKRLNKNNNRIQYPAQGESRPPIIELRDSWEGQLARLEKDIQQRKREGSFEEEWKNFEEESRDKIIPIISMGSFNQQKWRFLVWALVPFSILLGLFPDVSKGFTMWTTLVLGATFILSIIATQLLIYYSKNQIKEKAKEVLNEICLKAKDIEKEILLFGPKKFKNARDQLLLRIGKYNLKIIQAEIERQERYNRLLGYHKEKLLSYKDRALKLLGELIPSSNRGFEDFTWEGSSTIELEPLKKDSPEEDNLIYSFKTAIDQLDRKPQNRQIKIGKRYTSIDSSVLKLVDHIEFERDLIYEPTRLYTS